ncbi:hypothetical protein F2Q70_00013675 [Brassica cretica]|uniref:Uncharacterized protein n=1 Tax=Brassica cretica TaxID=69181 RepID=A0A8S9LVT0_BRACR|nr:hypothetical protein F2Q70_00013675 [Brassica cretica]
MREASSHQQWSIAIGAVTYSRRCQRSFASPLWSPCIRSERLRCGEETHVVDNYYRPDLMKAALARLSVISKGLRVAKSGPKRRNRQA